MTSTAGAAPSGLVYAGGDRQTAERAVDDEVELEAVKDISGRRADAAFDSAQVVVDEHQRTTLDGREVQDGPVLDESGSASLDSKALWALAAQHVSSTISDRSAEFAVYLFLISLFPTTLLPSSLYGFFTTGCALVFSGPVGGLVDTRRRLRVVRATIAVQKVSVAIAYSALLVLFLHLRSQAAEAGSDIGSGSFPLVWFLFSVIVAAGSALKLGTVCLSVAIERDWVTTISAGSGARLTRLNVILRRIDLGSKLLCPLFVSLLTSTAGDVAAVSTLFGIAGAGMVFELVWINVVWRTWPILAEEENARRLRNGIDTDASAPVGSLTLFQRTSNLVKALPSGLRQIVDDWRSFIHVSIFPTSLAVSLLYFTVLSFDGTMISWLKTSTYSDGLIAGMRGLAVLMGLMGTVLAPWLEKRVGLVRAAGWSIWSEVVCLVPVLLSFYIASPDYRKSSAWNQALLFSGMAASRVGLWSFDLCQLKQLQVGLQDHPRRNALSGLQFSLQNLADLLKYVLTIVLNRPTQFRFAAAASFGAVLLAALVYSAYMRSVRGHLVHLDWAFQLLKKQD